MEYIALKPCTFDGRTFLIGETIPESYIIPERAKALVNCGRIASTESAEATLESSNAITVPVLDDDSFIDANTTVENLCEALKIIQTTAATATEKIAECDSEETLLLVSSFDSRKGVKAAAEKRFDELSERKAGEA